MRKFTILAVLFALVAVVTGCKKDNANPSEPSQPVKEPMTFYAYPQGGERTGLDTDGNTSIWTGGDVIKIFSSSDTEGSLFTLTEGAGTNYGVFDGEIVKSSNYAAAYPASLASGQDGSIIIFDMQSSQNYVENTYAPNTVPVVSYTTTNKLEFVNTTGLLRLGIKTTADVTVTKMVLTDNNSTAKLWGKFKVTATDSGLEYVEGGDNTLTINLGSGVALNSSTYTYFFFCLPAGTLAGGFTVDMESADGKLASIGYIGNEIITELNVGKPYDASGVKFVVPTTGEAYATAVGGNVKWVQLWKDGPKWAEYNVGATTTTGESSYGGYYAWGGSQSKVDDHNTGTDPLSGDSDTATKLWGSNWQMPTKEDFQALLANCDVVWKNKTTSEYGVAGRLYTGKGDYSGNSVFFPAAGYYSNGEVYRAGSGGYYWSSTPNGDNTAYDLDFNSSFHYVGNYGRYDGQSVRAVLK